MTISEIIQALNLKVYNGSDKLEQSVTGAYASDLLSDVMGRAKEGFVWITMQTHKNILAVASLKELAAIIIVNNGSPDSDTLNTAAGEGIVVLGTADSSFTICGKLYQIMERNAVV